MWDNGFWWIEYWNIDFWGEETISGSVGAGRIEVRKQRLGPLSVRIFVERS